MHILLTGATGNLGKNALSELLRQGHRVRCFVRQPKALESLTRRSTGSIDPVQATDHYTAHKIACEEMVKASGLQWTIFRSF